MSSFGKPLYDKSANGNSLYKKRKTLKEGSNIRRIMPPFGSAAPKGQWAVYTAVHYGWSIPNPTNPDKPIPKPFECVRRRKKVGSEYMVLQECEACLKIEEVRAEQAAIIQKCKDEGLSKEETQDRLEPTNLWLQSHNLDRKWNLNVMDENGNFEWLAISSTCYQRLEQLIEKLRLDGIDPIDIDGGVWIDFKRTIPPGKTLRDADDIPEVVTETVIENGKRFRVPKAAPLSPEILEKAEKECVDLKRQYLSIKPDRIKELVECDGSPEAVAAILGLTDEASPREQSPVTTQVQRPSLQAKAPPTAKTVKPSPSEEVVYSTWERPQSPPKVGAPKRPGQTPPSDVLSREAAARAIFGDEE